MKHEQDTPQTLSALLRSANWVDAPVNNSLCCAAAGITASSQANAEAEALIPQEKLRRAAAPEATLIAQNRPPAQPAEGYKHDRHAQYFLKRETGIPIELLSVSRPDQLASERRDFASTLWKISQLKA